jgi:NAD(P)-dependent dehydrogenase (short-subunit alcohol dehydrogenase family)
MPRGTGEMRVRSRARNARIINTSSASGLFGNAGQSNYGAAIAD